MEKINIKNRKNQNIVVLLEKNSKSKDLAFVVHGLGGYKEQKHIVAFCNAFKSKGITVVRFDTTNTYGESEGKYEDATTTNYYEDLEDIIDWSKTQDWYEEPFFLAGHSLGGICVILYAEKFPNRVKGLAPISTVVSGKLSAEARGKEEMESWEKTGWEITKSESVPGRIKRLPWSHMIDRLKYDVLTHVDRLTMPALLMVGKNDDSTPPSHQRILFDKLPGKKEIHFINDANHNFIGKNYEGNLRELTRIMSAWIGSIL